MAVVQQQQQEEEEEEEEEEARYTWWSSDDSDVVWDAESSGEEADAYTSRGWKVRLPPRTTPRPRKRKK